MDEEDLLPGRKPVLPKDLTLLGIAELEAISPGSKPRSRALRPR